MGPSITMGKSGRVPCGISAIRWGAEADTLILEAKFDYAPDTTMPAAAQATVNAADKSCTAAQ